MGTDDTEETNVKLVVQVSAMLLAARITKFGYTAFAENKKNHIETAVDAAMELIGEVKSRYR